MTSDSNAQCADKVLEPVTHPEILKLRSELEEYKKTHPISVEEIKGILELEATPYQVYECVYMCKFCKGSSDTGDYKDHLPDCVYLYLDKFVEFQPMYDSQKELYKRIGVLERTIARLNKMMADWDTFDDDLKSHYMRTVDELLDDSQD